MDITISHACPSCGGPVEMDEADRLTVCPWCEVQNYMAGGRMLRFVLPDAIPEHIRPEAVIYFPYLRFKGNIYTCIGRKVGAKVLDTTYQGLDIRLLPPSLGLRPQAMKIAIAGEQMAGRFVKRAATPAEVLQRAEKQARSVMELDSMADRLHHRAFIGESVSCLYLPLYIDKDRIYDGVVNRPLGPVSSWSEQSFEYMRYRTKWEPTFLSMICPRCGDTMRGKPNSLIVSCFNCDSCWSEDKGRFSRVDFRLVEAPGRIRYLPFWRLDVEASGIEMKTFGDYLSITNQPMVVRRIHQEQPLQFWIPALKIRPKVFLTMAKGATLSQLVYPEGHQELDQNIVFPTLPMQEAAQAVKSVFAKTAVNRKDVLPMLNDMSVSIRKATLVFLPFKDTGHDLVQHHSSLSVAVSVIRTASRL